MQEVNNTETQQQIASFVQESNVLETTQTNLNEEKPKQNSFLITLLSILLLLACVIAGFFAYQTQTLVKELTTLKNTTEPTPVTSPLPTEAPVATGSAVVTGTENWKTYTNSTYKFLIKHSDNWFSKNYDPAEDRIPYLYNPSNNYEIQFAYHKDDPNVINEMTGKPMVTDFSEYKSTTINGIKVYVNDNLQGADAKYMKYYFKMSDTEYVSVLAPLTKSATNAVWDEATVSIVKQIISTFKFTN